MAFLRQFSEGFRFYILLFTHYPGAESYLYTGSAGIVNYTILRKQFIVFQMYIIH